MSDSQTLYLSNAGSVTALEEWKQPRELRGEQPGNRAELLTEDRRPHWREERQGSRSTTAAAMASEDSQFPPAIGLVPAAVVVRDAKSLAQAIPAPTLVAPSKMAGGWFREDPW